MNSSSPVAPTTKETAAKESKAVEITDDNFADLVGRAPMPVLVDFWAAWCAPCRATAPHIEALAREYEGRVRVGKVDADANQALAVKLDVRSLPTFFVFNNGQVVGQIVGAVTKTKLDDLIKKGLRAGPPANQ